MKRHEEGGKNLYLSPSALARTEYGRGEWDLEYGIVTNAIFPHERCAAHVGEEAFGGHGPSVSFVDLQVRVYDLEEPASSVRHRIDARGSAIIQTLTGKWAAPEHTQQGPWTRSVMEYRRFYNDYGGTARVDIRYQQFGSHTLAFAFLYVPSRLRTHDRTIDAILTSFQPPPPESPAAEP